MGSPPSRSEPEERGTQVSPSTKEPQNAVVRVQSTASLRVQVPEARQGGDEPHLSSPRNSLNMWELNPHPKALPMVVRMDLALGAADRSDCDLQLRLLPLHRAMAIAISRKRRNGLSQNGYG